MESQEKFTVLLTERKMQLYGNLVHATSSTISTFFRMGWKQSSEPIKFEHWTLHRFQQ